MSDSYETTTTVNPTETYHSHNSSLFVGRRTELDMIATTVEAVQRGEEEHPIIELYGPPGMGKSWILRQAREILSREGTRALPLFVDLAQVASTGNPNTDAQALVATLQEQAALQPDISLMPEEDHQPTHLRMPESLVTFQQRGQLLNLSPETAQALRAFVVQIDQAMTHGNTTPVLILDHTDAVDEEMVDLIEQYLLYPFCSAGVGKHPKAVALFAESCWQRWKVFEVRKRIDSRELQPLTQEETAEQLAMLGVEDEESPALVHAIHNLSGGHPLTNEVILATLRDVTTREEVSLNAALLENEGHCQEVGRAIQGQVVEAVFLGNLEAAVQADRVAQRARQGVPAAVLRNAFAAACILRRFSPSTLREFTQAVHTTEEHQVNSLDIIRVMQSDILGNLVKPDPGLYRLDPTARHIMSQALLLSNPEHFAQLHQLALALYDGWIERFPSNAAGYIPEELFHSASAQHAQGLSMEDRAGQAEQRFREKWRMVKESPDAQWNLAAIAQKLGTNLDDSELAALVTQNALHQMQEIVRSDIEEEETELVEA